MGPVGCLGGGSGSAGTGGSTSSGSCSGFRAGAGGGLQHAAAAAGVRRMRVLRQHCKPCWQAAGSLEQRQRLLLPGWHRRQRQQLWRRQHRRRGQLGFNKGRQGRAGGGRRRRFWQRQQRRPKGVPTAYEQGAACRAARQAALMQQAALRQAALMRIIQAQPAATATLQALTWAAPAATAASAPALVPVPGRLPPCARALRPAGAGRTTAASSCLRRCHVLAVLLCRGR